MVEKNIDLGVSGGIGGSYPINETISVSLEARNNMGLSSFVKTGETFTNSTNLILGLTFHLKE